MASNEQSVTLLRQNKRAQVAALNSLGFKLTEGARAADFPMYLKWGAGLLDVTVAANRKSDNKKFFFTVDEWLSLSVTEQNLFFLRGIRVRAKAQSFVIAPDTITGKQWGGTGNISDMHYFPGTNPLYQYFDAYEETTILANALNGRTENSVIGAPAAECALAYKAYTLDRDGADDDTPWCLPTAAHGDIIEEYLTEIDAAFTAVWSADFKIRRETHWTCCKYDTNNAYYFNPNIGSVYVSNPTNSYSVRPISLE